MGIISEMNPLKKTKKPQLFMVIIFSAIAIQCIYIQQLPLTTVIHQKVSFIVFMIF